MSAEETQINSLAQFLSTVYVTGIMDGMGDVMAKGVYKRNNSLCVDLALKEWEKWIPAAKSTLALMENMKADDTQSIKPQIVNAIQSLEP